MLIPRVHPLTLIPYLLICLHPLTTMEEELARALDRVLILSGGDVQRGEFTGLGRRHVKTSRLIHNSIQSVE